MGDLEGEERKMGDVPRPSFHPFFWSLAVSLQDQILSTLLPCFPSQPDFFSWGQFLFLQNHLFWWRPFFQMRLLKKLKSEGQRILSVQTPALSGGPRLRTYFTYLCQMEGCCLRSCGQRASSFRALGICGCFNGVEESSGQHWARVQEPAHLGGALASC